MCEIPCEHDPLKCLSEPPAKKRPFTALLLYCWQTEYDQRPYECFRFHVIKFMQRMAREYDVSRDLRVILKYLQSRNMRSVSFSGITVSNLRARLLRDLADVLMPVRVIELKLMRLPREFFVMLRLNARCMSVTSLSLEGTSLTDDDVAMLREFLLVTPTLRHLNLSSCGITQFNFALIADGVYKSAKVCDFDCSRILGRHLSLDTQKLTHTLASLVWQNRLVALTMQQCELLAQDVLTLAEYLERKDCCMRKLNIAYNRIAADGTEYLMHAIAQSSTLEWLDISGNGIGTLGGECVAHNLCACKMLQHLYINNNAIDAAAINLLLCSIKKPIKLLKLYIYGNAFDAKTAKIVRRLLDAHVLTQDSIDVTYTYDEAIMEWRIIPWH